MEISDLLGIPSVLPVLKQSGGPDDSVTVNTALSNASIVTLAPGQWNVNGFTIPANKKVALLPETVVRTSGTIQLVTDNSFMVGHYAGINARQNGAFNYNIQWNGPPNGTIIGIGTDGNPNGCLSNTISGINLHGGGIAGVTGIKMGSIGGGCTWAKLINVGFINFQAGLNVFHGCQGNRFSNLHFWNDVVSTGAGIEIGGTGNPSNGSGCTTNFFDFGVVDGYRNCVKIGGSNIGETGAGLVVFRDYTFEMEDPAGILINILQGNQYEFHGCFHEAPGPPNTVRICQIGDANHTINGVKFFGGWMQGTFAECFHLFGFRRFGVYGTDIDASGGTCTAIVNDGSNANKFRGTWLPTGIAMGNSSVEASGINGASPWDGFDNSYQMNWSSVLGGMAADQGFRPSMRLGLYKKYSTPGAGAVTNLFPTNIRCEFTVTNNNNSWAKFYCTGSGGAGLVQMITTTPISAGNFSDVKDTAGKMNIYQDNVANMVVLQNNSASGSEVRIRIFEDGEAGT